MTRLFFLQGVFGRLLRLAALALIIAISLFVITVPLDLKSQWMFGIGMIAATFAAGRVKSRRATMVICVLTLLASTRYMFWRTTQTLEFGWPLEAVLGIGLYLAEVYAWIILVLGFLQTSWPLQRPVLELEGPDRKLPTVDVYIPTYNESLDIVSNTVFAAMAMDYPRDRFRVFILDDGRRPEFRAFARQAGCGYLTRDNNLHAKAGNLNAAMKRTDGELICVFDCDHVPTRAFLQMTIGWFQRDPKLAVLQTPHHFYSPDPVQRNLTEIEDMPGEGDLFYGSVQSGNDLWNATFFCGSCAIMRRSALDVTNGFAGETVTEDAHTALKLQRMGWNTAYINVRLSAGLATERLAQHIGQRMRWARGMTQILRIDNPLFGRGLKWPQRLCYLNAMLHFQFPLPRIVFLTSPLAYLLFGQNIIHAPAELIFAYALPHLFNSTRSSVRLQGKERRVFWGEIYETLLAFHLVKPTIWTFFSPRKGKFNVTDKGALLDRNFFDYHILRPHLIAASLLLIGLAVGYLKLLWPNTFHIQMGTLLLNTAWSLFSLLILTAAIAVGRETKQVREDVRIETRLPVTIYFEDGHVVDSCTANASTGGLAIALPKGFNVKNRIATDVALPLGDGICTLPVETVRASEDDLRVRFAPLNIHQQRQLVGALMGRADAWQPDMDLPGTHSLDALVDLFKVSAATVTKARQHASSSRARAGAAAASLLLMVGAALGIAALSPRPAYAQTPTATANATAAPSTRDASGVRKTSFSLKDMGAGSKIRLQGTQGEIGLPFGMRQDEVATAAALTLNFAYSPSLLPDLSNLVVLINGEVVRSIPLPRSAANGVSISFPVNPAFLVPGDNRLNLRFLAHYTRGCEDPMHSSLWANISNTRSYLQVTTQQLPVKPDLALLPAPFFDKGAMGKLNLPFVFAGAPSDGELEAASSVASWFGSLASFRGFAFHPQFGTIPHGNAIVFATPKRTVAGLHLQIAGPGIAVVANPADPLGSLLVVMGRDERELKLAAAALATGANALSGQFASADGIRIPVRHPYDAPRWLPSDRPVRLGQLVDPLTLQGQGIPPGALTAGFRVAPDLFFWPRSGAELNVRYRYPAAKWLDHEGSRLDLLMNGQYLRTLPMKGISWWDRLTGGTGAKSVHSHARAMLPAYAMFGQNELTFIYNMQLANKKACEGTMPSDVRTSIDPDSSIDLNGARHYTRLPNLAFFASAGFPFTRVADMGDTAVLLSAHPSPAEIEALFAVMGRFGDATGAAATRLTVLRTADPDRLADKDILVIGPTAMAATMPLFRNAPVRLVNGHLRVAATSPLGRVFSFLSPVVRDNPADVDDFLVGTGNFEGIAGFASPFSSSHSVVALLATAPGQLPDLIYGLKERKVNEQVQGDLSVLTGDQMTSFRVGHSFWSGSIPLWLKVAYWFSERPMMMVLSAIFIAILISGPLVLVLRHQERKRLAQLEERK